MINIQKSILTWSDIKDLTSWNPQVDRVLFFFKLWIAIRPKWEIKNDNILKVIIFQCVTNQSIPNKNCII